MNMLFKMYGDDAMEMMDADRQAYDDAAEFASQTRGAPVPVVPEVAAIDDEILF